MIRSPFCWLSLFVLCRDTGEDVADRNGLCAAGAALALVGNGELHPTQIISNAAIAQILYMSSMRIISSFILLPKGNSANSFRS